MYTYKNFTKNIIFFLNNILSLWKKNTQQISDLISVIYISQIH